MKEKKESNKKVRKIRLNLEDECIWMKTGVVNLRLCDHDYDCYNCPFHEEMQNTISAKDTVEIEYRESGWVEHLSTRYQNAEEQPCRYASTGRIDAPKICPLNYECFDCAFGRIMDEMDKSDLAKLSYPPSYYLASGYKMAKGHYYHQGHCWVRLEREGRVRIGFNDFMVRLFGSFQFLSLPPLGVTLQKGRVGFTFGRGDYRAASLSPVTGTVLAVNHKVCEHPENIHEDPYHEGWLCVLKPDMLKKNLQGLYFGNESMLWMEQENQKLLQLMGPKYERLAAIGAEPISDVFGSFQELEWDLIVKTFLGIEKKQRGYIGDIPKNWSKWHRAIY